MQDLECQRSDVQRFLWVGGASGCKLLCKFTCVRPSRLDAKFAVSTELNLINKLKSLENHCKNVIRYSE
jgi:hypothetical protein